MTVKTRETQGQRRYGAVVAALGGEAGVAAGGGKGFGSGALKYRGKIFAMLSSGGELVVKLAAGRVEELAAGGKGKRFEPRPGRAMREWLVVKAEAEWTARAREALEHARGGGRG